MNNVAMDIVVDLCFCCNYFKKTLGEKELFLWASEAIKEHPELVRKYLGTVIPQKTIIMQLWIPVFLMDLLLYSKAFVAQWNFPLRINQAGTGQFERTYLLPMKAVMYRT
jgi:Fe-S cluster assembly protein SufB